MIAAPANQSPELQSKLLQKLPVEVLPHLASVSVVHLKLLEQNPVWTQRHIADAMGVSLCMTTSACAL